MADGSQGTDVRPRGLTSERKHNGFGDNVASREHPLLFHYRRRGRAQREQSLLGEAPGRVIPAADELRRIEAALAALPPGERPGWRRDLEAGGIPVKGTARDEFRQGLQFGAYRMATRVHRLFGTRPGVFATRFKQYPQIAPYGGYSATSLDPVDVARTAGFAMGTTWPVFTLVFEPRVVCRLAAARRAVSRSARRLLDVLTGGEVSRTFAALAAFELDAGERDVRVWAKSMARVEGDEEKARVWYTKLRGRQLRRQAKRAPTPPVSRPRGNEGVDSRSGCRFIPVSV